ncbi:GNAT family N-acetyltransferase [Pseudoluteimonas lycopersici]|uniref:GNAT family N-acetyltransferase n=1 Tax=Pseudoluteimonas lycopersici TaxID=1324796 RepID=A0A516V6Q0_9GAMM|nr:GNAT family N-acetyltransferase [Lysobacter lycopersici]QDQ74181.1 GNAT family N-acetyltransferase [Lysobacter lycopersici]
MAARSALIRAAIIADAAEIARLSAQLGYPARVGVFAGRLERMSRSPTHAVLVCEGEGGRLAGFIGLEQRLMIESGDKAEIVGLVVDADARRTGAGRRLVAAAEDWAHSRGLLELFLRSNVVRPEAHAFYPALGFERSKTQHVYRKALT